MKTNGVPFVVMTVVAWLALIAAGIALAAWSAGEPPFWDALSYAEKSKNFWDNINAGLWISPLDVYRTIRPPGVIPISYPFGFTLDFHGFYFRWAFIPIALLATAAMVAGWHPQRKPASAGAVLALTLVLAGMPFLYQFQPTEFLRTQSNWGLVDGFLASLSALATASAMRSVRAQSIGWAITTACVAAYGLFVKPAGLILMGLVGMAWIVLSAASVGWRISTLRHDRRFRVYVLGSLAGAAAIYAWSVHAAFTSEYYSSQNIQFGIRNLQIFREELINVIDVDLLALLLHHSVGWLVLIVIAVGWSMALMRCRHIASAGLSILAFSAGVWFWIFTTNIGDVRYFLPFVTMAFILVMPMVLEAAEMLPARWTYAASAMAAAPAMIVTVLLFIPTPPLSLQGGLGVNLLTNAYQAENAQATRLLDEMKTTGRENWQVYIFGTTSATRNFGSVIDYHSVLDRGDMYVATVLPVDWQRGLAFRFDEIVQSDYIVIQPIRSAIRRARALETPVVTDYEAQALLMNAWAAGLGPADGVELVSETRLRLFRVRDPERLTKALRDFAKRYQWPKPFRDSNASHWWSADAATP